ncbi:hypothetical protein SNE40_019850 [Patella caerulea]|uniref:THAP-type domain-containing protein n=1 Tax=Patella caerulea TaxID=87958 RepID=A0AAN8G9H9_PATCE
MVKRCAWGTCNSDSRYPERLTGGITFIPFPKLGRTHDKVKRWIRLCGRPFEQLNEEILGERRKAKHLFVRSKHFVNGQPDPIAALHYDDHITQPRPPPKPRSNYIEKTAVIESKVLRVSIKSNNDIEYENCGLNALNNKMVQTENVVDAVIGFQPMDILAHAAENIKMKEEYAKLILENENLKRSQVKQVDKGTSIDLSTQN